MGTQQQLQTLLKTLTPHVYFQSPGKQSMLYPCIVYRRDASKTTFADNAPYANTKRYQVTVIAKDPDDPLPDKVAALPMCTFNRFFTAENLNHDVYNLYF